MKPQTEPTPAWLKTGLYIERPPGEFRWKAWNFKKLFDEHLTITCDRNTIASPLISVETHHAQYEMIGPVGLAFEAYAKYRGLPL